MLTEESLMKGLSMKVWAELGALEETIESCSLDPWQICVIQLIFNDTAVIKNMYEPWSQDWERIHYQVYHFLWVWPLAIKKTYLHFSILTCETKIVLSQRIVERGRGENVTQIAPDRLCKNTWMLNLIIIPYLIFARDIIILATKTVIIYD